VVRVQVRAEGGEAGVKERCSVRGERQRGRGGADKRGGVKAQQSKPLQMPPCVRQRGAEEARAVVRGVV